MKISKKEFDRTLKDWQTDNQHQRLGQYFCNKYPFMRKKDPYLFKGENDSQSQATILSRYVDFSIKE